MSVALCSLGRPWPWPSAWPGLPVVDPSRVTSSARPSGDLGVSPVPLTPRSLMPILLPVSTTRTATTSPWAILVLGGIGSPSEQPGSFVGIGSATGAVRTRALGGFLGPFAGGSDTMRLR